MMFGAPNVWGLDASGKIVRDRETDQYKAAVAYLRDLWASGLIWPDAPTSTDQRANFVGKKFAMCVEGFGNSWNDFWLRGLKQSPPTNFDMILPFSADANTKVQSYITGGYISTNVMKKSQPRSRERAAAHHGLPRQAVRDPGRPADHLRPDARGLHDRGRRQPESDY